MPQQHTGCSISMGWYPAFLCYDCNTRREIKPVYHLSTHPARFSNPAAGEKREKKPKTQVETLDAVGAQRSKKLHLLEGTRCLSSCIPAAVIARQWEVCCKKQAPTWKLWADLGLLADSRPHCDERGALGHSWAEVQGGADGVASVPNPASHHVSPSQPGLSTGNSLHPCLCSWAFPAHWASNCSSLPCLWVLTKTMFVFSLVSSLLCICRSQLISYNTQLLHFWSVAQVIADQM